jgi:NAD(P)H-hydrate epimerase
VGPDLARYENDYHDQVSQDVATMHTFIAVLSLDVPSGLDATTGAAPGAVIRPTRTLALALLKTGLEQVPGELYLADMGIPPEVYRHLGITLGSLWGRRYWIRLEKEG